MTRRTQLPIWGDAADEPAVERQPSPWPPAHQRRLARCNPEMLIWLRERSNLTVQAAAKKIGVDPARLASWESTASQPTVPQLRKIANAYKRPLAAFYLSERPRDFSLPHDYRRLPEAERTFSPALMLALRLAEYRRSVAVDLEPTPGTDATFVGSVGTDTSSLALADTARGLLDVSLDEQWGWRDEYAPLNAWKNAIERLGVLVFHFTGVKVDEVRGFSFGETPYPVIAVNGHDSVNGRVFTLAHELAHLFLGQAASCDLGDYSRAFGDTDPIEVYCNAFAGNLLVPRQALLAEPAVAAADAATQWQDDDLHALARKYGVSREVVLRRLLTLRKANEDFYRQWRSELLWVPPREEDEESGTGGPGFARMVVRDVGKPYARMVLDAYRRDSITGSDVADYLGARLKHLPKIEAHLGGRDVLTGGAP